MARLRTEPRRLAPATGFFGRERDLEAVTELLRSGKRLVTILGPPGVGKTRCALELGDRLAGDGEARGGVHLCDLSDATTAVELSAAVAEALGAPVPPGEAADAHVTRVLAARPGAVLLLDELERLATAATPLLTEWLARTPVAIVATSRVRLETHEATVYDLLPLARDAALGRSPAAALFLDRARAAGVTLGFDAAADVGAIVDRLDGLPLAIELAAGRLRVLDLAELRARLERSLGVLGGGRGRHATLATALDDSWQLLPEAERDALAQASVFAGGFTLEAAEAVLSPRCPTSRDVVELVQALVDQSLVARQGAEGGRLGLLESVRAYARARLDEGDGAPAARSRHAAYYARLGRKIDDEVERAMTREDAARPRLLARVERHNLEAAAAHALTSAEPGAAETALDAALALQRPLRALGRRTGGPDPLVAAMRAIEGLPGWRGAPGARRAMARALVLRSDALRLGGDIGASIAGSSEAMELARSVDAADLEATALAARGDARWPHDPEGARADLDAALALLERAQQVRPALERRGAAIRALHGVHIRLARHHHRLGRPTEALEHAHLAVELAASIDDAADEAWARLFIAAAHAELGAAARVVDASRRALDLAAGAGDGRIAPFAEYLLGVAAQERGELEIARPHFEQSIERARYFGAARQEAVSRLHLGRLHVEEGRFEEGERELASALGQLGAVGHARAGCLALAAMAVARARQGDPEAAERTLERAAEGADAATAACVDLARATVDAAHASASRDTLSVAEHLRSADARISPLDPAAWETRRRIASRSEDVRTHERLARAAVAEARKAAGRAVLEVGAGGAWFRLDDGPRVDLSKKRALAGLVAALAAARREKPGSAIELTDLLAAGWPGVKMQADAAHNRLYVALSTLRRLGLREVIVTAGAGWRLDAGFDVAFPPE